MFENTICLGCGKVVNNSFLQAVFGDGINSFDGGKVVNIFVCGKSINALKMPINMSKNPNLHVDTQKKLSN